MTVDITAKISQWALVSLYEQAGGDNKETTLLFGLVEWDCEGRFPPNRWIHTSRVTSWDFNKGIVETLNSVYQLEGGGLELEAHTLFYVIFARTGQSPQSICEQHPEFIYSRKKVVLGKA